MDDLVIDGDRIAAPRNTGLRNWGTGAIGDVAIVDSLRIRNGLVVYLTEIVDSPQRRVAGGMLISCNAPARNLQLRSCNA